MDPLLTILLPTHTRVETLEWALASIANQTLENFEVLVCGDGCTDATAELVLTRMKTDPRIRFYDLPKAPGFGYANRKASMDLTDTSTI